MKKLLERLNEENDALVFKIHKLYQFLGTYQFEILSKKAKKLLKKQHKYMKKYWVILLKRIKLLESKGDL